MGRDRKQISVNFRIILLLGVIAVLNMTVSKVLTAAPSDILLTLPDAPVLVNSIDDVEIDEGFETHIIDLSGVFVDSDGDPLTYTALSSNTGIARTSVIGKSLIITEGWPGYVTITVTASDGFSTVDDQFIFKIVDVNSPPTILYPAKDQNLLEHFGSVELNLLSVFYDPEGDHLIITATSSDAGVVSVAIDGDSLVISEVGLGIATIYLEASDAEFTVQTQFDVTVNNVNDPPRMIVDIPDQTVVLDYYITEIDLTEIFTDPDGDTLRFSSESFNIDTVTVANTDTMLTITGIGIGVAKIIVTASDLYYTITDTITVTVVQGYDMKLNLSTRRLISEDTIVICNDAGEIDISVSSAVSWSVVEEAKWIAVQIVNFKKFSVSFTENITGADREDSITVIDDLDHAIKLIIKQLADCDPEAVNDEFLLETRMYPNPVEDVLFLTFEKMEYDEIRVDVIDSNGKLLSQEELYVGSSNQVQIDMSEFTQGIYFIRISNDRGSYIDKVVKE